jgi:hypothetical protein
MGGRTQVFEYGDSSTDRVWAAALRAVSQLGCTVLHSDQPSKVLSFNTGRSMSSWAGQDLTMTLGVDGADCDMTVGGSPGQGGNPFGGGQIFSWGEKARLIESFAVKVYEVLAETPEPAETAEPAAPAARTAATTEDLSGQLERLAALHSSGSLTDEEFRAAKARLLG